MRRPSIQPITVVRGISLANKTVLLFSIAIFVFTTLALVPSAAFLRNVVDQSQLDSSRQIGRLYEAQVFVDRTIVELFSRDIDVADAVSRDISIEYYAAEEWPDAVRADPLDQAFIEAAREALSAAPGAETEAESLASESPPEYSDALWRDGDRQYRYARLVRSSDGSEEGVLVIIRRSQVAASLLIVYRVLLVISGIVASIFAIGLFYLIIKSIVLSPVRRLTSTAVTVRKGNLLIRSDIRTGDEFEELSNAFNDMLANLADQQAKLRAANKTLDLRLTEMAEANVSLFESAKLKGEFLASVSHELRTPLNSIIGFAEVLQGIIERERSIALDTLEDHVLEERLKQLKKRGRYIDNIMNAGNALLEMINELLTMAKLEAGKITLNVETLSPSDAAEALSALIRPLADRKRITLSTEFGGVSLPTAGGRPGAGLPLIKTDPTKLQQIVFNFLSNAVKFTPEEGSVTLRVERLLDRDGSQSVRFSVIDSGPGIPHDQQKLIFEKFRQVDASHTRNAAGTGLGLAIAKQFADMLSAEIQLVSNPGQGSMFSVIVPLTIEAPDRKVPAKQMLSELPFDLP